MRWAIRANPEALLAPDEPARRRELWKIRAVAAIASDTA